MSNVISLDSRRHRRKTLQPSRAHCYVDLACPFSYLTAERVDRAFSRVSWRLAFNSVLQRRDPTADAARTERMRAAAESRAAQLRLPLEWPDRYPLEAPAAMRAAAYAIEQGRGGEFVMAAGRLAFCGGFDLEDPEILAEAAAAASVGLDDCLAAARDPRHDAPIEAASRSLLAAGVDRLPAVRVGGSLLWGERRISAYLAAGPVRATALSR